MVLTKLCLYIKLCQQVIIPTRKYYMIMCSQTFCKTAERFSSIGLGFFNPTVKLKRWDVTSFCLQ